MKTRTKFVIGGALILAVIIAMSVQELQETTVFFYTPQEVLASPSNFEDKTIRIGALVQKGSVEWNAKEIQLYFNITEDDNEFIHVSYAGVKPDLFREGQGVVVEGKLRDKKYFLADKILAKHDENYMPPEVSKALEKANN